MKGTRNTAVLLAGAVIWLTCIAGAQTPTTGAIAGVVKDPSGAVVSSARVALSNAAGVERDATTDATGHYAFLLLPREAIASRQTGRASAKPWKR